MPNAPYFVSSIVIPNNAAAASLHNLDVTKTRQPLSDEGYSYLTIHNPGAVAITVRLFNRENIGGSERFDEIDNFVVAIGATEGRRVRDWPSGDTTADRLQVSPNALVGAAGTFTVHVEVRRPD